MILELLPAQDVCHLAEEGAHDFVGAVLVCDGDECIASARMSDVLSESRGRLLLLLTNWRLSAVRRGPIMMLLILISRDFKMQLNFFKELHSYS